MAILFLFIFNITLMNIREKFFKVNKISYIMNIFKITIDISQWNLRKINSFIPVSSKFVTMCPSLNLFRFYFPADPKTK